MQKFSYLATCPAGFESEAALLLTRELKGASPERTSGGAVWFSLSHPLAPAFIPDYVTNIFYILREWNTSANPFSELVKQSARKSSIVQMPAGYAPRSFRVRFSRENRFESVDKRVAAAAESFIAASTGARSDRLGSGGEYWFIVRSESWSAFALRLERKKTGKEAGEPVKGELSGALASLVVLRAAQDLDSRTADPLVILDPCAGHGALPERASALCPGSKVIAGDIDSVSVAAMKKRFAGKPGISVYQGDLRTLDGIAPASVDLLVTDPPWGMWEEGGYSDGQGIPELYAALLESASRVLKTGGRLCVLTGAKRDFENAVAHSSAFSEKAACAGFRTDILVNGKKAALYVMDA